MNYESILSFLIGSLCGVVVAATSAIAALQIEVRSIWRLETVQPTVALPLIFDSPDVQQQFESGPVGLT